MSIVIALLGLGLLIFVHESGHFFASLAVGLRPRRFYVGFPPALVKVKRNGIEYGVSPIPLGGFVSIPGMHRPIPHDAERRFSRAVSEAPGLAGPVERVKRALAGDDLQATLPALDELEEAMRDRPALAGRGHFGGEGLHRAPRRARPGRVLEGRHLAAARRHRRGACGEHRARDLPHDRALHDERREGDVDRGDGALWSRPRNRLGFVPATESSRSAESRVGASGIADRIQDSKGQKLVVTVVRDGQVVRLTPVSARPEDGVYRLGFVLRGQRARAGRGRRAGVPGERDR